MCTDAQIGRALGLPGELGRGRAAFWRQIAWREFYHHHLARHPHVARQALRGPFRDIAWSNDAASLATWRAGQTGYPLVDAGMRQLAGEGWMHNRARMVAASFLVKDLLVDWRRGETVFMQGLDRRRSGQQQRRLAVDGRDGDGRGPLLPRLQSRAAKQEVRPRGHVYPTLGAGAAGGPGALHPRAVADG